MAHPDAKNPEEKRFYGNSEFFTNVITFILLHV